MGIKNQSVTKTPPHSLSITENCSIFRGLIFLGLNLKSLVIMERFKLAYIGLQGIQHQENQVHDD